jgi:outer membrane lipoprotein-sorting protein
VPADGAEDVDPIQQLRIRFDRPMDPHHLKLEWLAGGFQLTGSIEVSADQKEFALPVCLTAGHLQTVALNYDEMREMMKRAGQKGPKPARSAAGGFVDTALAPANEFRWSFQTKEAPTKPDAAKPRMVAVSPGSGAATPVLTLVEITFDQPMRPPEEGLPFLRKKPGPFGGGASLLPNIEYDSASHRFTLPALLPPEEDTRLTLNGFFSADGVPCDTIVLHYQTGSDSLDPAYVERAKAAAKDPELRNVLAGMKKARAHLSSGVEMAQMIDLRLSQSQTAFSSIDAKTALFKWCAPDRVYADISGPMSMGRPTAFVLGSDGQFCWLYSENDKGEKRLVTKTSTTYTEIETTLVDPFGLANGAIDDVLAQKALVLSSKAQVDGRSCYRIESCWEVSQGAMVYATKNQWWIDEETLLLKQLVQYCPGGCQIVRFDYAQLNESLPQSAFEPPVAPVDKTNPLFFTEEPKPGEQRFLRISDGSNGRMSGRIGWQDQNGGTYSSGLN